ncbi:unnamed protein product, partial [Ectocarpus sp. 8 AP-2014]
CQLLIPRSLLRHQRQPFYPHIHPYGLTSVSPSCMENTGKMLQGLARCRDEENSVSVQTQTTPVPISTLIPPSQNHMCMTTYPNIFVYDLYDQKTLKSTPPPRTHLQTGYKRGIVYIPTRNKYGVVLAQKKQKCAKNDMNIESRDDMTTNTQANASYTILLNTYTQ